MKNNDDTRDAMMLGVGLDNRDGHKRVTRGDNFCLIGGSEETHDRMVREEELDRSFIGRPDQAADGTKIPLWCNIAAVRDVKQVLEVIRKCDVHGVAHITGGGFDENIPRVLHEGLGLEIHEGSWEILPVFRMLEKWGGVPHREMFNIFNMGIGMVIVLDEAEAGKAIGILESRGEKASVIGKVTAEPGVNIIMR